MRILVVCGDRNWTDQGLIEEILWEYQPCIVIHGVASGADWMAGLVSQRNGWPEAQVPAQWKYYGKAAGPLRNGWMLDLQPDLVLAFHDNIEESRGTKNCLEQARKRGIPTRLIRHDRK